MGSTCRIARLFSASLLVALSAACGGADSPPPATPTTQVAPMTTVVLDAGAAVAVADPSVPSAPDPSTDPAATDAGAALTAQVAPAATSATPATPSGPDYYSCGADTDCVAVPLAGCCHNGHKAAVNTSSVAAYKASVSCPKHHLCPMYMVRDNRIAKCAPDTKKCVLVNP